MIGAGHIAIVVAEATLSLAQFSIQRHSRESVWTELRRLSFLYMENKMAQENIQNFIYTKSLLAIVCKKNEKKELFRLHGLIEKV